MKNRTMYALYERRKLTTNWEGQPRIYETLHAARQSQYSEIESIVKVRVSIERVKTVKKPDRSIWQ